MVASNIFKFKTRPPNEIHLEFFEGDHTLTKYCDRLGSLSLKVNSSSHWRRLNLKVEFSMMAQYLEIVASLDPPGAGTTEEEARLRIDWTSNISPKL